VTGLLDGVRVIDFTRVLAGPYAAMVLADLGAQVIKVELPGRGDDARGFGPFQNGESAYFASINRGKQSVTIDLHREEGQELARRLTGKCDVLIENFRPGSMARFGLDYPRLHALYPGLVYASVSGFGQTGPYAELPAYDIVIQAMGGIASITGPPGGEPVRVGSSIADLSAALFSVVGILAALLRARADGQGQQVDIAMLDCQVAMLENAIARYAVSDEVPGPLGSRHPSITPFQFFAAADGHIVVAAGNDGLWRRLCAVLGVPELATDPRFATNALRTENQAELETLLTARLQVRTVSAWCQLLGEQGIPCGPINTVADLMEDPQVAARGMIVGVDHPRAGHQVLAGSPLKLSENAVRSAGPAPTLGEHTDQVLTGLLGLSPDEVTVLRESGVV
jgi:crotonobetainyl-CoA:carnitine CoA-transferase CaiB-like acyl-CoA transferase